MIPNIEMEKNGSYTIEFSKFKENFGEMKIIHVNILDLKRAFLNL